MNRTFFAMSALCACLLASRAAAQTPAASPQAAEPTPEPSHRPSQQVAADGSYVFDGRSSLRMTMKQIYNRKDGSSVYFGEDFGFFHSACGASAFCNTIGGHDTDLRLGFQVAEPDVFLAVSSGNFAGNGGSLSAIGFGVEKLARGEQPMEITASFFYYPSASGTYSCPALAASCFTTPVSPNPEFQIVRYTVGAHYALGAAPFYVNFGVAGDNGKPNGSQLQPYVFSHNGAYLGLGFKM